MSTNQAYPLAWPAGWQRTRYPSAARFETKSLARAVDETMHQLKLLGARQVVISSNIELRLDGFPRSGQKRPSDSGVAVYFKLSGKDRVLACDKWHTVEDNLWAVAKHIEALRGQNRWGVGTLDQAFVGYAALPAPANDWQAVLGVAPDASVDEINMAYRKKALTTHSDVGGTDEAMQRLNAAREMALRGRA